MSAPETPTTIRQESAADRVGCVCVPPYRRLLVNQRRANVGALLRPSSTAPARTTVSTAGLLHLAIRFS